MPDVINIEITGAVIGPSKQDGTEWDGFGAVNAQALTDLAVLLATGSGYSQIISLLGGPILTAYNEPDPFGGAELAWAGAYDSALDIVLASESNNTEDTYTPDWPAPPVPGWVNVPVTTGLRVRVTLIDEDLVNNDAIGTVELKYEDFRQAFLAGTILPVQVSTQSANQILYINISVTSACDPTCLAHGCGQVEPCGTVCGNACDSGCTAHCSNGVQDCDETAKDCGGATCGACGACGDTCYGHDGTCDPSFIGACDGCDLGCGVHDPDCDGGACLSACPCLGGDSSWYCDNTNDCTDCQCECDTGADAICS